MHSLHLNSKRYGHVNLHHHSDWSGEAIIDYTDPHTNNRANVRIPGVLLVALGKEAAMDIARTTAIRAFEDMFSKDFPNLEV